MSSFDPSIFEALARGTCSDPFAHLGQHIRDGRPEVTVFVPGADRVVLLDSKGKSLGDMKKLHDDGGFHLRLTRRRNPFAYQLRCFEGDSSREMSDPYQFGPILGETDEYLMAEGRHEELWTRLGAHPMVHEGVAGTGFAVWAPNAQRVSVVGDFNAWNGLCHPMRKRLGGGLWELFLPAVGAGAPYKFEIVGVGGDPLPLKADPFAFQMEHPPLTASLVSGGIEHAWADDAWMTSDRKYLRDQPVSIYEVHLGSWRRGDGDKTLSYAEVAPLLAEYVRDMGFTHVEFLPLSEHPFSPSWGYQPIGLFAPTSRFGSPDEFAALVDQLHQSGIGVIMDWVPAHFPSDEHGLARFDGTALYEHEDSRLGFHKDWNTLIYNFGRNEVANFLRASALYWLKELHIDALRVDAVASMLYLDYSREEGEWIPNRDGGRENLEAIAFLQDVNTQVAERTGSVTIAEESTAFPGVSRPVDQGGLGFGFKWNMGWMHDTLQYMSEDPINRRWHHDKMTFGLHYAFSENFVLPLSHDEVVHGKGSLLGKMPGDTWQKFANLRAYFSWMWAHPGKKLLFMGGEFAQEREWAHDFSLDWHLLEDSKHVGIQNLVRDLNALYRENAALYQRDCEPEGFQWIDGGDRENNVFSFVRYGKNAAQPVVVICNMSPVLRQGFRVGLPLAGRWKELFNSDAENFGGSGAGNGGVVDAQRQGRHGQPNSAEMTLPPLSVLFLTPDQAGS